MLKLTQKIPDVCANYHGYIANSNGDLLYWIVTDISTGKNYRVDNFGAVIGVASPTEVNFIG